MESNRIQYKAFLKPNHNYNCRLLVPGLELIYLWNGFSIIGRHYNLVESVYVAVQVTRVNYSQYCIHIRCYVIVTILFSILTQYVYSCTMWTTKIYLLVFIVSIQRSSVCYRRLRSLGGQKLILRRILPSSCSSEGSASDIWVR